MDFYNMMTRYQFKTISDLLYFVGLIIIINLIQIYLDLPDKAFVSIFTNTLLFLYMLYPDIIWYWRYRKFSKNVWVTVDSKNRKIKVDVNGLIKNYTFDDVKSISRICTENAGQRKSRHIRLGDYYYFVILLNNSEKIIITSLMTDKEKIDIAGKPIEVIPQGKAWIYKDDKIVNLYKQ